MIACDRRQASQSRMTGSVHSSAADSRTALRNLTSVIATRRSLAYEVRHHEACAGLRRTLQWRQRGLHMTSRRQFRRSILLAAILGLFAGVAASPARADSCDDIAKQLSQAIDGLKVNFKAGNIIYLTHPAATELSLGCRGKEYSNELYAKGDRKLKLEF